MIAPRPTRCRGSAGLEELDRVAGRVLEQDLLAAPPARGLVAEVRSRPAQRLHLAGQATALTDPALSACVAALIQAAGQHPEVREFLHGYSARRRRALVEAIAAGVRAGDFPATTEPELAAQSLSGAIFYRRFMTGEPFQAERVDDLIDLVLGPPQPA